MERFRADPPSFDVPAPHVKPSNGPHNPFPADDLVKRVASLEELLKVQWAPECGHHHPYGGSSAGGSGGMYGGPDAGDSSRVGGMDGI